MAGKLSVYQANRVLNKLMRGEDYVVPNAYCIGLFKATNDTALRANIVASVEEVTAVVPAAGVVGSDRPRGFPAAFRVEAATRRLLFPLKEVVDDRHALRARVRPVASFCGVRRRGLAAETEEVLVERRPDLLIERVDLGDRFTGGVAGVQRFRRHFVPLLEGEACATNGCCVVPGYSRHPASSVSSCWCPLGIGRFAALP